MANQAANIPNGFGETVDLKGTPFESWSDDRVGPVRRSSPRTGPCRSSSTVSRAR